MKYGDRHMIHTDLYKPDSTKCCEACIFGRGEHTDWCEEFESPLISGAPSGNGAD